MCVYVYVYVYVYVCGCVGVSVGVWVARLSILGSNIELYVHEVHTINKLLYRHIIDVEMVISVVDTITH